MRIARRYARKVPRRYVAIAAAVAAVGALVPLTAWLFRMPVAEAAVAAPIIVVSAGALVGLFVLWTKVIVETLRRQRHPGRIVAGAVAAFAVLVVLSFFVELPAGH